MMMMALIPPPFWLGLATAGWYLATRVLSDRSEVGRSSSFAFSLPFATTCLIAVFLGHPEIAIGVTLAGSVAALTLVLGLIGLTYPVVWPDAAPKYGFFLLPTAFICLLIGLSGRIRIIHAVILLVQGGAIVFGSSLKSPPAAHVRVTPARLFLGAVATLAMVIASVLAVRTGDAVSRDLQQPGDGLIAAVMLAPALVLPLIGFTGRLAGEKRSGDAVNLLVKVVLTNLCLLLPLSALAWDLRPAAGLTDFYLNISSTPTLTTAQPSTTPSTEPSAETARSLSRAFIYPLSVWRIDTILIVGLGFLLAQMAFGRFTLGRVESTALLFLYMIYLWLTATAGR